MEKDKFFKLAKFFLCASAALIIPSLLYMAVTYGANAFYVSQKARLASTDLSEITIDGLKPGDIPGELNRGSFITVEDGVIAEITGELFWDVSSAGTIEFRGEKLATGIGLDERLTSAKEIIDALGGNYLTAYFRHESSKPSIIYRDREHGLELRLFYLGAELSKAPEPLNTPDFEIRDKGEVLFALRSPLVYLFSVMFSVNSGLNFTIFEHIFIPLFFALLLTPAAACFVFRKKRVIIPVVIIYIVYGIFQFREFFMFASQ
ncbi:MAG: hypothetical protein LBM98_11250 [Oscillospiraceae bacterium]|jgi:hypothetical protein|nr:hypothetical protein [Oscillospiraceae bacterium]